MSGTRDVWTDDVAPVADREGGSVSRHVVRDTRIVPGGAPLHLHRLVTQVQIVQLVERVVLHQVVQVLLHLDVPCRRIVIISVEVEVWKSRLHFWAIAELRMK